MAAESVIGCFIASTWAKIIAWLQITINVIVAGFVIWILVVGLLEEKEHKRVKAGALGILGFGLASCTLGFSMGIILLNGLRWGKNRKVLLTVWVIFAMVQIVWSIVNLIVGDGGFVVRIVYFCVNLFLYGFGTRVVYSLIQSRPESEFI